MLGLVTARMQGGGAFAPSTPAALYPVGARSAVERAVVAAVEAGADTVALVTNSEAVHDRLIHHHEGVPIRRVAPDDPAATLPVDGDPVLFLDGATVYDGTDLESLVDDAPAITAGAWPGTPQRELARGVAGSPAYAAAAVGVPADGDCTVRELLASVRAADDARRVDVDGQLDVRRPWEYLSATERALAGLDRSLDGDVHDRAECRGAVRVASGAVVDAGSVVEGPALIATGATVGPNARVRGATVVGPDARVGHAVEVKNTILMREARVPHLSYVGDSVVGPDANVGAGSQIANLRHDDEPVRIGHRGERVSSGRRKFGAVIGEGARLGIGTRLDAGVVLGPETSTVPGETVMRDRRAGE